MLCLCECARFRQKREGNSDYRKMFASLNSEIIVTISHTVLIQPKYKKISVSHRIRAPIKSVFNQLNKLPYPLHFDARAGRLSDGVDVGAATADDARDARR